jgi:hypothetical protein
MMLKNLARAQLFNSVLKKYAKEYKVSDMLIKNGTRTPRVLKARNAAIEELSVRRWDNEAIARAFNISPITVRNVIYKEKVTRRQ